MRIAIIGAGISGIGAALALDRQSGNHVVLYEREIRPGGHSSTVDIDHDGTHIAVDTGFIVYNEHNYPNFTAMLDWLDVRTQPSDMSFAVSADAGGYEWCGRDPRDRPFSALYVFNGLFAQRRNLVSPRHWRLLLEVVRFQETARRDLRAGSVGGGSLQDYLTRRACSQHLRDNYLVPMGAAIWSTSPAQMLEFPAQSFLAFFDNHCLLQWERPRWRSIAGGSRSYVRKAISQLGGELRLGTAVTAIRRLPRSVEVTDSRGLTDSFDHVVLAAHAPDALSMLSDPDSREQELLSACSYAPNKVYLHRDARLMPRRKAAWAAWNFLRAGRNDDRKVAVSYWMNALQNIPQEKPVFVTLNPPIEPAPELTFASFTYDHPQFDAGALAAASALPEIQGERRTWYCGAWTGYGFHEDGLRSGLAVAEALGASAPWLAAHVETRAAAE